MQQVVNATKAKLLRVKAKIKKEHLRFWKELFRKLKKIIIAPNKRSNLKDLNKERNYIIYNKMTKIK